MRTPADSLGWSLALVLVVVPGAINFSLTLVFLLGSLALAAAPAKARARAIARLGHLPQHHEHSQPGIPTPNEPNTAGRISLTGSTSHARPTG